MAEENVESTAAATAQETIRLVLGVARLGEVDLAGWWGSHGLDRVGRFVLSRSFRRTWRSVALELDIEAAARRHNTATGGRKTALHLFSDQLPFRRWATAWLAEQKTAHEPDPLFDELIAWDLPRARETLEAWAGHAQRTEIVGEGLRLGVLHRTELDDPAVLTASARLLTATYLDIDGHFQVPYYDLQG